MAGLRMIPLMAIPLILYGIAALFINDPSTPVAGPDIAAMHPFWDRGFAEFRLLSGQTWAMTFGQAIIVVAAFCFFFSVMRSASSAPQTVIGTMLSVVVLCLFIVAFLTLTNFGTSVFFVLAVFAFLDTLAAIALSMMTSRARIRGAVEA